LLGKDGRAQMKALKQLTFYTVPTATLKTASLQELSPGETLVGYKVHYRTGAEMTILVEGVGLR
jgi:hypothetical protein